MTEKKRNVNLVKLLKKKKEKKEIVFIGYPSEEVMQPHGLAGHVKIALSFKACH